MYIAEKPMRPHKRFSYEVSRCCGRRIAEGSRTKIRRVVADRAYDSGPLDERLRKKGAELISPHKRNCRKPKTQGRRKLRHYKHRWTVECFFAWLHNYRKCVVKYKRKADNFQGFLYLAAIIMLLRYS
jgi:transposase